MPSKPGLDRWLLAGLALCLLVTSATAQVPAAATTTRLRGTVRAITATTLTVQDRKGETITLELPAAVPISEVFPVALADIKVGSFIGTAALPQADGSQRAIAVTVFPEAARGVGEGHRAFDLLPQSTMTNATVAQVMSDPVGSTLQVTYKDGHKTIIISQGTPVVTFKPGDRSLLEPGASVSIAVQLMNEKPTAARISAGRKGFVLPY